MRWWDGLIGRPHAKAPDLDSLFMVPSAAVTLQAQLGLRATGSGSVCYRAPGGAAYATTEADIVGLLAADDSAPTVQTTKDSYGFTWLFTGPAVGPVVQELPEAATSELCTDLHAVNTSLEAAGFGDGLLCTVVVFVDPAGRRIGLVYLYKQGTFYAFAPEPGGDADATSGTRDNLLEISIRDALAAELPMEPDLQRWLALWGAPGL